MRIGRHDLDRAVLVVAEIGNNHEGDAGRAAALVDMAADAGAGAVKLQTFVPELYVSRLDADRIARLRAFALPERVLVDLAARARARGMLFLSTPFDLESARVLAPLVDAYKIASGDNTFGPLLDDVASRGRPVILSTGLATAGEIDAAVDRVRAARPRGAPLGLVLLHCVSAYPVPPAEANLRAIAALAARTDLPVGYSDHVLGIEASVLAVAAGARLVEKHVTLDRAQSSFRDHRLSADPAQLAELVRRVREAEAMLGDGALAPRPCERDAIVATRRSTVARRDLDAGHELRPDDLAWTRPGGGVDPDDAHRLVGRVLAAPAPAGTMLEPALLRDEAAAR